MNGTTMTEPEIQHKEAAAWIDEMARLCQPDTIYWCDGSEEEKERLTRECLASGELEELNQEILLRDVDCSAR